MDVRGLFAVLVMLLASPATAQTAVSDNLAMTRLFDADQAERDGDLTKVDWNAIAIADTERRIATKALIDAGKLTTATDFWHAAFVFQHGRDASDYLYAHSLAVTAAAKGHPRAPWIAAASLDRYLMKIGQPQVYGTQFQTPGDGTATQEPYNRALLSDAIRAIVNVPPLAAQEQQREEMARRAPKKERITPDRSRRSGAGSPSMPTPRRRGR